MAKNAVVTAPDAWEFVASFNSTPDPNQDISAWTSLGELAGSDDGGSVWTRHCGGGSFGPMMAARYRLYGHWSLFSVPIYTEA